MSESYLCRETKEVFSSSDETVIRMMRNHPSLSYMTLEDLHILSQSSFRHEYRFYDLPLVEGIEQVFEEIGCSPDSL